MNTSLSVLLPVHNREDQLAEQVHELLDVVSELTADFDLLIIDDGSTDDTAEVAGELARQYPQIGVIRHPYRRGLADAVQTGLKHSHGETVIVGDEQYGFNPLDLRKLWPLRNDPDVVVARQPRRAAQSASWLQRLVGWRDAAPVAEQRGGLQLIRRQALREMHLLDEDMGRGAMGQGCRLDRSAGKSPTKVRGPKFLGPVKRFILEE